jgi:SSS family solute:Na+ symporter
MQIPLLLSVVTMGMVTAFYTMMGGVKAVIWTDTIQVATVLVGFAVVAVTALNRIPGGVTEVMTIGLAQNKFALFDFSSNVTHVDNFWALLIGGTILNVQAMSTDQAVLQKYFTTKSETETAKAICFYGGVAIVIGTLLSVLGVILFAYYFHHPEVKASLKNPDALVPHYAASVLHHGLAGLVVASILAGSMSTVSASLNSLATSSVVDIYKRIFRTNGSDAHYTFACRCATCLWGSAATVGAMYADRLGPLVLGFAKIQSLLGGLLLGIFLLALLSKRSTARGVICGLVVALGIVIAFALYWPVSIYLYGAVGCFGTMAAGWLFSRILSQIPMKSAVV